MAISGRLYNMSFQNVTVSAVQDMLSVYAGANKVFAVQQVSLGQISASTVTSARIRLRYYAPTVTAGSGGTAGVFQPYVAGDVPATVTGRLNDTLQAFTSAPNIDIFDDCWSLLNGFIWQPAVGARPPVIAQGGAFVVSLDTVLASVICSGSILIEELP